MLNKTTVRLGIQGSLIIILFAYSYFYGIQKGMHQTVPGAIYRNDMAMSIAISDLKYGLKGYQGYNIVLNTLTKNGMTDDPDVLVKYGKTKEEALTDPLLLQGAIDKTLNISNVAFYGRHNFMRDDIGMAAYYKIAFRIFGFKIEGFYYLYFLILFVSVMCYVAAFYRRPELLNLLVVFLCSHLIIMTTLPKLGIEMQTVHNVRFIPMLTFLPVIHLALLITGGHRASPLFLAGAILQASIIILAYHVRSSALLQILTLVGVFIVYVFAYLSKNRPAGAYVLNRVSVWPVVLVILCFLCLKFYLATTLHYSYSEELGSHYLWHPAYLGLGEHPDSREVIGCHGSECDDHIAAAVVHKRLLQVYGKNGDEHYTDILHEAIMKDAFLKLVMERPGYVFVNYLYKPWSFIKGYFSPAYGLAGSLFNPAVLAVIVVSMLSAGPAIRRGLRRNVSVLGVCFFFWFLMLIFFKFDILYISENSLLLTMFIYLLFAATVSMAADAIIRRTKYLNI